MQTHTHGTALKVVSLSLSAPFFLAFLFLVPSLTHASGTIVATTTVANFVGVNNQTASTTIATPNATTGVNDQTLTSATTTANVLQTSASRTLTVNSVPTNAQTSTIGSCVVTYSTATTTDSLNCTGNTATLSITTHNTAALLAAALSTVTHITDPVHGALTVATSSSTSVVFTTAGTEASTTTVGFTDGTSGAVSSTATVAGVIPVAEQLTLTIGGTPENGDTFTVTSPAAFTASYVSPLAGQATSTVASGIVSAIQAASGYGALGFTAATSTNFVVLTAKVAGVPFYETSSATNRVAAAQVNTVAIGGTTVTGAQYSITIPSYGATTYSALGTDTYAGIVNHLATQLQATSSYSSFLFTVSTSSTNVILTAKTPGTGFTETSSASGTVSVAQVVTFVVPTITGYVNAAITLNSVNYSANNLGNQSGIVANLVSALSGASGVSCAASGSTITCTATTPGVAFTYASSLSTLTPFTNEGVGGSNGSSIGNWKFYHPTAHTSSSGSDTGEVSGVVSSSITSTPVTPGSSSSVTTSSVPSGASTIKVTLKYKSRNNSVKIVQQLLGSDSSMNYTGGVTGYYGLSTQAAVEAFQVQHSIVQPGQKGYGNVGKKTKAMLVQVYGA